MRQWRHFDRRLLGASLSAHIQENGCTKTHRIVCQSHQRGKVSPFVSVELYMALVGVRVEDDQVSQEVTSLLRDQLSSEFFECPYSRILCYGLLCVLKAWTPAFQTLSRGNRVFISKVIHLPLVAMWSDVCHGLKSEPLLLPFQLFPSVAWTFSFFWLASLEADTRQNIDLLFGLCRIKTFGTRSHHLSRQQRRTPRLFPASSRIYDNYWHEQLYEDTIVHD